MPSLPLVVHETKKFGYSCTHSRTADQMCRQDSWVRLTAEEALAAEESLSVYCKPVELYNILQRRALHNPTFLQRCLHYKIQARRKRRIQITLSLSGKVNDEIQSESVFPLYVLLARPVADTGIGEHSAVYRLNQARVLTAFSEFGKRDQTEANFVIPDMKKLYADAKSSNLTIILVSHGEAKDCSGESHLPNYLKEPATSTSKLEGNRFWGKLPIVSLCSSLEKCASFNLGHEAGMLLSLDMQSSLLEPSHLDQYNCIMFRASQNLGSVSPLYQVQVSISAREVGAREKSPYDSYTYDDVPTSSLSHIIRLRTGNVIFNYRYYNNSLQKTEVTEDFSCPFCLVQCMSFKGMRYHLTSSHDLFNFEFWVTEEYQAVNVSVKTDIWRSEIVADGVDPRLQTFFYCSRFRKCRRSKNPVQNVHHVHPHVLNLDSPEVAMDVSGEDGCSNKDEKARFSENHVLLATHKSASYGSEDPGAMECADPGGSSPDSMGVCAASAQASAGNEYAHPESGSNLVPTAMLQFAKSRKLSVERADPRNRALLQKRQFFHSHRAQPMELEQVYSDRDSEDEVDDDIADFEDRRMLDDFVDVTKDEKQIMHLWNSFVRKQRVLADGHIPWACEAFSQLHGQDLVQAPALLWCWRLLMIKLWNHSLLDARAMNNCNLILERFQNETSGRKQS